MLKMIHELLDNCRVFDEFGPIFKKNEFKIRHSVFPMSRKILLMVGPVIVQKGRFILMFTFTENILKIKSMEGNIIDFLKRMNVENIRRDTMHSSEHKLVLYLDEDTKKLFAKILLQPLDIRISRYDR